MAPVGFVSDHTEVVHDLTWKPDERAAAALGLGFARAGTAGPIPRPSGWSAELVRSACRGRAPRAWGEWTRALIPARQTAGRSAPPGGRGCAARTLAWLAPRSGAARISATSQAGTSAATPRSQPHSEVVAPVPRLLAVDQPVASRAHPRIAAAEAPMKVFRGGPSMVPDGVQERDERARAQAKRSAGRPATHRARGVGGVGRRASARAPHRLTRRPPPRTPATRRRVVIARPARGGDSASGDSKRLGARGSSRH